MTMEPVPPRKPKDLPFYQIPEHVQTSSRIVSEAKTALQMPSTRQSTDARVPLRTLSTKRPETPQTAGRQLFGDQSSRDPTNRPPSAFSLGSRHFESESRPASGTRLMPLDHKPKVPACDPESPVGSVAPKPPANPNRPVRRTPSRQKLHHQLSVDSFPSQPPDLLMRASGSLTDVSLASPVSSVPTTPESQRRVRSGPKERTKQYGEDRGEVDGADSGKRKRSKDRRDTERVESGYVSDAAQRDGSAGSQRTSSAGKSGSAGRREEETSEEALYYNTKVGPLVDKMATHIVKEKDHHQLTELSCKLYSALDEGNLLGKACKRRSGILKTVFKLLDLESPKLLLSLARLIFALKVSGNNLINVCKLVFKVSREEKNDAYFLEGNMLELLVETSRTTDYSTATEALVYCIGTLKFLSGNSTTVKHLVKKHCIDAMGKLLISVNRSMESSKPGDQFGHILVQLTATLRNLADVSGTRSQFLALGLVDELCRVIDTYHHDADIMLNVVRIFSKITIHTDCCSALAAESAHFKSLLMLLHKYYKREDLVIRICFILGNLTSKNDQAREQMMAQDRCLDKLLAVFKHYWDLDLKNSKEKDGNSRVNAEGSSAKAPTKLEDVLIKMIRVIANLSISEVIGPTVAASQGCVDLLTQILAHKSLQGSEELVLNAMVTINNLSFYNTSNSAITARQLPLSEGLLKFLQVKPIEGLAEATRVFGNLSREKTIRDFLVKHKVDEFMVAMLDSGERDVVFTAVGVLINLMADEDKRPVLKAHAGITKLIEVLRDFGHDDWTLASMVCQTLWNYSGKITSTNACFGEQDAQELQNLLEEYLDEETVLEKLEVDQDLQQYVRDTWETDFCPVATQLLERIEAHQSNFEPLEHPS